MAYSSGGLIQASDYNNFVSGTNQINTIWSTGYASAGYGQTALSGVNSAGTVTASQWSTLINTLNSIYTHQTGSGSGISTVLSGSLIAYISTLAGSINTAYGNKLTANTQGTVATGSVFSPNFTVAATTAAQTWTFTRTITFASGDQARYFFNAGGTFNFVTTSVANNDGSSRSSDWQTLIGTNFNGLNAFGATSNGGRTGVGGTVNTSRTNLGYWGLSTSDITASQITTLSATYSGDYILLGLRTNGTQGSNGDNGNVVYIDFTVFSPTQSSALNNSINVTWNHRIDIVPPETTNLSNSWGSITIS